VGRTKVWIGIAFLGILLTFGLTALPSNSLRGSFNLLPPGDLVRIHNDTPGDVFIQASCPRFLRQLNVCEFRSLPVFGNLPAGDYVVLPPQPPPGTTTWFRISDASQRVLGCVSIQFALPIHTNSATEIPDVNVSQLASCPNREDDP
jgi:hypothetical protein